jgi:hypothetical protein
MKTVKVSEMQEFIKELETSDLLMLKLLIEKLMIDRKQEKERGK